MLVSSINQFLSWFKIFFYVYKMDFLDSCQKLGTVPIPLYMKNALLYTNYANKVSFSSLSLSSFTEIQEFMRNNFCKIIPTHAKKKDFYGIFFQDDHENFQFSPGDGALILDDTITSLFY